MKRIHLVAFLAFLIFGLVSGAILGYRVKKPFMSADLVYEQQARPDIASLQQITAASATDGEALAAIQHYYERKHSYLSVLWNEVDESRLRALFAMFVVHISHSYGVVEQPAETFLGYIRDQVRSHCAYQSRWQLEITRALGLKARMVSFSTGDHGWVEVLINEHYELFDSTTNLWLSESALVLVKGTARNYRTFYTPALDRNYPEARSYALETGQGNILMLRQNMIELGLAWQPEATLLVGETQ